MSRIDDALRRAEASEGLSSPEPRAPGPEPWVLERYQTEGRTLPSTMPGAVPDRPHGQTLAPQPAPVAAPVARRRVQARRITRTRAAGATADAKLVVAGNMPPLLVEQYRRLAATLHDLQVERGLRTLVVTSALRHDGKTLTAANLALTLSESYARRVLLIDADLRLPSVHQVMGVPNGAGLNEVLASETAALPLIEFSPSLSLMSGGQPNANPLAGLSSERMRSLLEECAAQFDWVLLDAPPVGLLPDGIILTRLTGACIFVIRAGATPFAAVERAVSELGRECIVGTVLNGLEENAIPATADYYEPR